MVTQLQKDEVALTLAVLAPQPYSSEPHTDNKAEIVTERDASTQIAAPIYPIRNPFGPPALGTKGFTRFRSPAPTEDSQPLHAWTFPPSNTTLA